MMWIPWIEWMSESKTHARRDQMNCFTSITFSSTWLRLRFTTSQYFHHFITLSSVVFRHSFIFRCSWWITMWYYEVEKDIRSAMKQKKTPCSSWDEWDLYFSGSIRDDGRRELIFKALKTVNSHSRREFEALKRSKEVKRNFIASFELPSHSP